MDFEKVQRRAIKMIKGPKKRLKWLELLSFFRRRPRNETIKFTESRRW